MVKNKTGGNRNKKQARKNLTAPVSTRLRIPKEQGEILAKVIKINGGGVYDVLCEDKVTRLLVLRKKFKGRNKRDNSIQLNKLLLVGQRMWEVVHPKKKQKVDLLYVYSNSQISDLRQKVSVSGDILPEGVEEEDDDAFEISSKNAWEDNNDRTIIGSLKEKSDENNKLMPEISKTVDFDFDDI
jgi:hypothetical protein|uniref:S1-like domain-containing protein n=1 Tax=viral metagenome TaxID=1070528 RepID=A0A6C0C4I6_9ZZZZ